MQHYECLKKCYGTLATSKSFFVLITICVDNNLMLNHSDMVMTWVLTPWS